MSIPTTLPEWDKNQLNIVEADNDHKDEGWLAPAGVPEKPPFQTFNWWQNLAYQWILRFKNVTGGLDNVTELLSFPEAVDGTSVNVRGYTLNNDGGGDVFNWDSTVDKSTADAGNIFDPGQTLVNQGNGTGNGCWVRQGIGPVNPKQFGAKGDWDHTLQTGTDDTIAIQNTINSLDEGGDIDVSKGLYRTTSTIIVDTAGITINGASGGPWDDISAFVGDHTNGPVLHCKAGQVAVYDLNTESSATRQAEPAAVGGTNFGLLYEPIDAPSTLIADGTFKRIGNADQPDSGFVISGGVRRVIAEQVYTKRCGGHALAITNGLLTGRTNKKDAGIITLTNCSAEACGGHALAIGEPGEVSRPYRVGIKNYEGSDCATDSNIRYSNDQLFIRGDNIRSVLAAFRGIQPSSQFSGGATVSGTNIELLNSRFIDCTYCVNISTVDSTTRNVKVDGFVVHNTVYGLDQANAIILPASSVFGVRVWAQLQISDPKITNIVSGTCPGLEVYYNAERITYGDTDYDDRLSAGKLALKPRSSTDVLTIASGQIEVTNSAHKVLNENGDASDDLVTITGGKDGDIIVLSAGTSSQAVTIKTSFSGTDTIQCGASDLVLNSSADRITLEYNTDRWFMLSFADNG